MFIITAVRRYLAKVKRYLIQYLGWRLGIVSPTTGPIKKPVFAELLGERIRLWNHPLNPFFSPSLRDIRAFEKMAEGIKGSIERSFDLNGFESDVIESIRGKGHHVLHNDEGPKKNKPLE